VDFPEYRGSDQRQTYALPIPYVVYRGERLKIDRQKVRGLLFSSDIAELDFSVSGTVPVKSRDNRARQEMPDHRSDTRSWAFGQRLLYRSLPSRMSVELRLPLRAVEATDLRSVPSRRLGCFTRRERGPERCARSGLETGFAGGSGIWQPGPITTIFTGSRPRSRPRNSRRPTRREAATPVCSSSVPLSKRYRNYWFGTFIKADSLHAGRVRRQPIGKQKYAFAAGFCCGVCVCEVGETVEAKE